MRTHNLGGSPIYVTEHCAEYRRVIVELHPSDVVLEVGCAEGCTTAMIAQHVTQAYGIDASESQVAKAVARHSHVSNLAFKQIDAWDLNAVLRWSQERSITFTVVFIDVSGSRPVGAVEQLLTKYEIVFHPRLMVVKNYQLKRLINRCRLYPPVEQQQQQPHQQQQQPLLQQQQQQEGQEQPREQEQQQAAGQLAMEQHQQPQENGAPVGTLLGLGTTSNSPGSAT